MNTNPQITIFAVHPSKPEFTDGEDLINLYFRIRDTGNGYRLHLSDNSKIQTEPHHLESGVPFTFRYDGLFWSITDFFVGPGPDGMLVASGHWSADPESQGGDGEGGGDVESGTFQAQAGGHPVEVGAKASA